MQEEWRPVETFEGHYEVSDHGRVRSLPRTLPMRNGHTRRYKGRVLCAAPSGRPKYAYWKVTLKDDVRKEQHYVHHLVAAAFLGPRPPSLEVAHDDGCRKNNRADNLRYATHAENHADRKRHGTHESGEDGSNAKLTWAMVREIRKRGVANESSSSLEKDYPVSARQIRKIVAGDQWPEWADPERQL